MTDICLVNLPVEILYRILDKCNTKTILLSVRRICKRLNKIVHQYDRFELRLDEYDEKNINLISNFGLESAIDSLEISPPHRFKRDWELSNRFYKIFQCSRVRHLTIYFSENENIHILNNLCLERLISLKITICGGQTVEMFAHISSILKKINIEKIEWTYLHYKIKDMPWPIQWKLKYLRIYSCLYNEFIIILNQLPYLTTFRLIDYVKNANCMDILSFNSFVSLSLTSLSIGDCSLSMEYLKSIISNLHKLRHLRINFKKKTFQSIDEIIDWEYFIRTEEFFLIQCQFRFSFEMPKTDWPNLEEFIIPFQKPFWLNEKHWFVTCEYIIKIPAMIILFTIPISYQFHEYGETVLGISSNIDTYYLTKRRDGISVNTILDQ
ncbi:unnamed protein product, partial [Rotaria sp. Silwood2]